MLIDCIKFDLPEEINNLHDCIRGTDYRLAFIAILERFRRMRKYDGRIRIDIEKAEEVIRHELEKRRLNIYEDHLAL